MLSRICRTAVLALALAPTAWAASDKIISLEVNLDAKVAAKGTGIRTLFIILYDSESNMPMPYGAMKIDLKEDAKGTVYKGEINSENLQIMGHQALPKTLRIKARLDKDGSAGGDQPGDLVGKLDKIKVGEQVKISIDSVL